MLNKCFFYSIIYPIYKLHCTYCGKYKYGLDLKIVNFLSSSEMYNFLDTMCIFFVIIIYEMSKSFLVVLE